MQESPPTQPPDITAAPVPEQGAATAVLPSGTIPLTGVPGTPQELQGLRARREILRDHLERAINRREELVSELNETGNPDAQAGLRERLTLLDERILQIERDQAATEQLISSAAPEVLAMTREPAAAPGGADDADLFAMFLFGFGVAVVVTWFIGRIRRRRRRKGEPAVLDDPRLERLSQAVDAIAEEVERIGEGQRFVTQLLADGRKTAALPADRVRKGD